MKKLTINAKFLIKKRQHLVSKKKYKKQKSLKRKKLKNFRVTKYDSIILEHVSGIREVNETAPRIPTINTSIPNRFSIIENPKESLAYILKFSKLLHKQAIPKMIHISHEKVQEIDLAAESIMGVVVKEYLKETRSRKIAPNIGGRLPTDKHLQRYIRSVGIIKNLEVQHEYLKKDEEKTLVIFRMRNKRLLDKDAVKIADFKEQVVAEFVDYINSCLNINGRELTKLAKIELADYTGEILANAEEHSHSDDWFIVGYLDNGYENHICEIAIFNFGKTIADTFNSLAPDSYTSAIIEPYIKLHEHKGFFNTEWERDDLLTLISIQGNISTKNLSKDGDRGQGTVEMIDFFQQVHSECAEKCKTHAKMSILSGKTHILFDGTHLMSEDKNGRKTIAFNDENLLTEKPDRKYIKNLGEISFPGTIISIMFPLQDTQTQQA